MLMTLLAAFDSSIGHDSTQFTSPSHENNISAAAAMIKIGQNAAQYNVENIEKMFLNNFVTVV